jgi:transcriptional regulator with XRE-family HTH domain
MILKSHSVSDIIFKKRTELKMSQYDVGSKLGWNNKNAQYISNIEKGKCQLPSKSVKSLSLALGVPVEEIIIAMCEDYKRALYLEVYNDIT